MTVLVTGGAGGIGGAVCREFAAAGYKVAINYFKSEESANRIVDEILEAGGMAKAYKADVSQPAEVSKMVVDVMADLGHVDVLINNAAVAYQGLITDTTDVIYDRLMDVNMKGAFNATKAVLPGMINRKDGVIINISSMWGEVGASCEVIYSASKAALLGFTKSLAKEVGPSGIRVNCISPGVVDTPMNSAHGERDMEELSNETPLERIGKPEEIAKATLFLASENASFITGQILGVNGGFII
ncbi:MAG: 3-oxoacyl-ACP reductase FabG [Clostridia bacterium]|nr:3-oxoacyl-ACP reductase FabG [Clostridia bacterium]